MSESETKSEKKCDVAISFLHKDETLAVAIDARLREHFNVFIYSKRQEELAETNGLESLREAFFTESRLVVVLYREAWRTTQWTRVEQQAITDRFLKDGWKGALNLTTDGFLSPFRQPKRIAETVFYFDYQPAYGWCWHSAASTDYYNAAGLAEEVLMRLLNLQDRFERGEIKWSDSE